MNKNKGVVFGVFVGIASCMLFLFAWESDLGAVLLLVAVAIFVGIKGADYFKLKATVSDDKGIESDELRERLAAVERQLTDVQEVVLAIDEKLERQEQREQG